MMSENCSSEQSFFPDFFRDADGTSIAGQGRFIKLTRYHLLLLLAAAVVGGFVWVKDDAGPDWAGVVAAIGFGAAVLCKILLLQQRPERDWYAGRAAAESAKTLTWRFAVCGDPFVKDMSTRNAERLYITRIRDVRECLKDLVLLEVGSRAGEVTEGMRSLRRETLATRKEWYLRDRLDDQREWYSKKANQNKRIAWRWAIAIVFIEVVALGGAVFKAIGAFDIGLFGIASAVVAAIAAWVEMRQYQVLASSYTVAARELSEVMVLGESVKTETEWAQFVGNAEEAISREHTMWAASRGQ